MHCKWYFVLIIVWIVLSLVLTSFAFIAGFCAWCKFPLVDFATHSLSVNLMFSGVMVLCGFPVGIYALAIVDSIIEENRHKN